MFASFNKYKYINIRLLLRVHGQLLGNSATFFFANLAKNIEEISMIIESCTKMKTIRTQDILNLSGFKVL